VTDIVFGVDVKMEVKVGTGNSNAKVYISIGYCTNPGIFAYFRDLLRSLIPPCNNQFLYYLDREVASAKLFFSCTLYKAYSYINTHI